MEMSEAPERTFDYIVVGGGSAGCILASRLSERPDRSVLLLEAGDWDNDWLIHIPLGVGKIWNNPRYNWSYMSAPEAELGGRNIYHPRGKVIGGSASINIMAFVRGNPGDYDQWAQSGLSDWSYEKVLPFFKRLETFEGGDPEARGSKGPIHVIRSDTNDPLVAAWLEAGRQAGHAVNSDYNGLEQDGFSPSQANMHRGRRQSSASRYLRPARTRRNLTIETNAATTRVLLEGKRATGVEYSKDGGTHHVAATREIVLTAGAYNTPQLLMLSGIGPADHLREHGIVPLHDVAGIGSNLQDHMCLLVEFKAAAPTRFTRNLRYDRLAMNLARAALFGSGPASRPMSLGMAFLKSDPRMALADLQLIFRAFARDAHEWFPGVRKPFEDRLGFVACHLRPAARGTVRLASADPAAPPVIHNRFIEHEADRLALRTGIRKVREIAAQPAFQSLVGDEVLPGPAAQTDAGLDDYVRSTAVTIFHPVGTCRMGADSGSVVDPELRLRGLDGLRIADASVMPQVVGGNTNACVMMIAEKASDLIPR
jgi:4-pyridoxate dehydrogenase